MPDAAAVPAIDPSPKPGDVTTFDQVKGAPPAPHPNLPPKGTVGGDPNRRGVPDDYMKGLDDLAKKGSKSEPEPKPSTSSPKAPTTPDTGTDVPESSKAPSSPPPATDPDDAALEAEAATFKDTKGLRQAWKDAIKREKAWKREQAEVSKRISEAEERLKGYDPKLVEATTEELKTSRTRLMELEDKVKALDYTHSTEFHDKHVKPLAKALESVYGDLAEMVVQDGEQQRAATKADFDAIVKLPLHEATARAKAMFGELAPEVLAHRRSVVQLKKAQAEAMENAGKLAEEAQKRSIIAAQERTQRLQSIAKQRVEELETKFPDIYRPQEGDEEVNTHLSKGHELVNLLDAPDITDEDRVKVAVEVRQRAAAFAPTLLRLQRTQAQLAEALKKLEGYEKSAPGDGIGAANGTPAPDANASPMDRAMKGLEKLAKAR